VYSEIEKSIGFKDIESVVEIGIGYGGQARVIHHLAGVRSYAFYDLPDVQKLADFFLDATSTQLSPRNLDINSVEHEKFDLVISNYAISELPARVQREYLAKVIAPTNHCYMIMNSGASDVTRRSTGKLAQSDFISSIPGVSVSPEIPSTGPDNYVLTK
jgi:protein-L-isoaspartate O-methyltransferase